MSTAVQQIQAILRDLTPAQRAAVNKYVDLASVNIMTLLEKDAVALLTRLKVAVGAATNPIKDSIDGRQEELDAKKAYATSVWEKAREAYYAQLAVVNSDESIENKEKTDELFLDMTLKGERMVAVTKRANNAAIQRIVTRDIALG